MTNTTTTTSARLRILADLIEAHPDLPPPYISACSSGSSVDADWFLHTRGLELADQKATAARVVSILGGQWDKTEDGDRFSFTQTRGGIIMRVWVARDAVCERVVTGSHEVTVPATPAKSAVPAQPAVTHQVEDVKWVCSSLLAGPVSS
jgi:hypothetical protein